MWYRKIVNDNSALPDFITHYENELVLAKNEIKLHGSLEQNLSRLPGQTDYRFSQLQDIEAILNYLNIQLRKIKRNYFQQYLEKYNRALTSRDAEKYADGEADVIDFELLINEVALLRNRYLGIIKGFEQKSFSISNISRLRCAGLENIEIEK